MIHRGLLFWSIAAVATAVGLFTVKYKVQDLEEKIDRTNQKIIESQQATHIRQGKQNAFKPAGSFDAAARRVNGVYTLYVRCWTHPRGRCAVTTYRRIWPPWGRGSAPLMAASRSMLTASLR